MFGRKLNASEALNAGLVSRVFAKDEFEESCKKALFSASKLPNGALKDMKASLRDQLKTHLKTLNREESYKLKSRWTSSEFSEAVNTFRSRRK